MPRRNTVEDFWSNVDKSEDCWVWLGNTDKDGYGLFWWEGKLQSAHRVVWQILYGPIPTDLCVLHKCDNPPCVRHLFLGTQLDNVRDCVAKGRHKSGAVTRPELMLRGEAISTSKLTDAQVVEIRRNHNGQTGYSLEMQRKYSMSRAAINKVLSGRAWKHLL